MKKEEVEVDKKIAELIQASQKQIQELKKIRKTIQKIKIKK